MNVGGNAPSGGTGDILIKKPIQGYREPHSIVKESSRGVTNHLISNCKKISSNTPQNNQNVFRSNSLQNGARNNDNASNGGDGHGE